MSVSSVASDPFAYLDQAFIGANDMSNNYVAPSPTGNEEEDAPQEMTLFGDDGFGFDDFLDIINPLQHLPVISNLYREITGDTLNPGARLIGGGIFGGGIGLAASIVNTAVEAQTGKDIGGHVLAMFDDDGDAPDTTDIASTSPAAASTSASTQPAGAESQITITPQAIAAAFVPPADKAAMDMQKSPVAAVQTLSASQANPQAQAAEPLAMGLQWKNGAPDIRNTLEKARSDDNPNLTDTQLQSILGSFKLAPVKSAEQPAPVNNVPALEPSQKDAQPVVNTVPVAAYEQQVSRTPIHTSAAYNHIDRII